MRDILLAQDGVERRGDGEGVRGVRVLRFSRGDAAVRRRVPRVRERGEGGAVVGAERGGRAREPGGRAARDGGNGGRISSVEARRRGGGGVARAIRRFGGADGGVSGRRRRRREIGSGVRERGGWVVGARAGAVRRAV